MLRTQLMSIARDPKHPNKLTKPKEYKDSVERDLRAYFKSAEGKRALSDAPRITFTDRGEVKQRQMTEDDAVAALLEEI